MRQFDNILRRRRIARMAMCNENEDYIWRVEVLSDGSVTMQYIGYCPIDTEKSLEYSSYEELPEWAKDRMAVLNMMPPYPNESVVWGVGRRIDATTWWIIEQPEERLRGNDTRSESKETGGGPA
jgi:hypothetical protein